MKTERKDMLMKWAEKDLTKDTVEKGSIITIPTCKDQTDEEIRTFIEKLEVENELEGIEKDNVVGREL